MNIKHKIETFNGTAANSTAVEVWNTRFGLSVRTVKRGDAVNRGRFANNITTKQLTKV